MNNKNILKSFVYRASIATGFTKVFHKTLFKNTLTILLYHSVIDKNIKLPDTCFLEKKSFESQLQWVRKNYTILSLKDSLTMLYEKKIKNPIAAITFDDGFQNNYDIAFPVLKKYEIPATIFISTDFIGTKKTVWYCDLHRAFNETDKKNIHWDDNEYNIISKEDKLKVLDNIINDIKRFKQIEIFEKVKKVLECLGNPQNQNLINSSPYKMLDEKSIKAMTETGLIEIGAHTATHCILNSVNKERQKSEIYKSLNKISEITGKTCEYFAYPNGNKKDYSNEAIRILKKAKVKAAFTTMPGPCKATTPVMELPRYNIGSNIPMETFKCYSQNFHPKYIEEKIKRLTKKYKK